MFAFTQICLYMYIFKYMYTHMYMMLPFSDCNKLQHTASHYKTLPHTATHCNTLQSTTALT